MPKDRQKQIKGWLEIWWYRFQDVKLTNFGRYESELAADYLAGVFGRQIFAIRRLVFSGILVITSALLAFAVLWSIETDESISEKLAPIQSFFGDDLSLPGIIQSPAFVLLMETLK